MRRLTAVLIVSSALAACSGSTTSDPVPLDQVSSELAKSFCAAEQACNPFYYQVAFANTDCVAAITQQFEEATFGQLQNAVNNLHTVKYDGNQARSCSNALAKGACAVLDNNSPDACQQAFVGSVAAGGDCDLDQECLGLSQCDVSGGACPGKCAARASAGVGCEKDADCALGLVCSPATRHCAAPAAEGEACKGGSAGNCSAGLLCVGNDDANKKAGTCKTAAETLTGASGASCSLQGPWCADGLSCVVQSISAGALNAICQPIAAAGAECGVGIPSQCAVGQYCPLALADFAANKFTANCSDLPAVGAPCAPATALDRCSANLVCDDSSAPTKPVCVKPAELGTSCSASALCYSKNCVAGTCVPASPCAE